MSDSRTTKTALIAIAACLAGIVAGWIAGSRFADREDVAPGSSRSPASPVATATPFRVPSNEELRWGEMVDGLQFAAVIQPGSGFVHCWMRNGSDAEITYNRYCLGYFASSGIEVRDGAEWVRLPRVPAGLRYYKGAGPSSGSMSRLAPQEIARRGGIAVVSAEARRDYSRATSSNGTTTVPKRADLPWFDDVGATIVVDLLDFEWPADALWNEIELRVVQELSGPGHDAPITIRSPTVRMSGTEIGELLERGIDSSAAGSEVEPPGHRATPTAFVGSS